MRKKNATEPPVLRKERVRLSMLSAIAIRTNKAHSSSPLLNFMAFQVGFISIRGHLVRIYLSPQGNSDVSNSWRPLTDKTAPRIEASCENSHETDRLQRTVTYFIAGRGAEVIGNTRMTTSILRFICVLNYPQHNQDAREWTALSTATLIRFRIYNRALSQTESNLRCPHRLAHQESA